MIVDCFPYFAPYGEELLKLRVNLLKDVVDKFIIVESNKTHSGKPVQRKFLDVALKQGLPKNKEGQEKTFVIEGMRSFFI